MLVNARAARIHRYGAPVVLKFEDVVIAESGGGEVLVRNTVICPKFVDVRFHRFRLSSATRRPGSSRRSCAVSCR
jgi:NADPH:quinone reductase-like Zn-dependent oxidoreductase